MQKRAFALIPILLLCLSIGVAHASYSISFIYSQFSQPAVFSATDQAYKSFIAKINVDVTWNETAAPTDFIQVTFSNSSDYLTQKSIDIKIFQDNTFQIWLTDFQFSL